MQPNISEFDRSKKFKMLWWLRRHPVHSVRILFGLDMAAHQRMAFEKMCDAESVILKFSRGGSKTFVDGLFLVRINVLYPNMTQVVLTKGYRGGKLVLREAMQPIIASSLEGQDKKLYAIKCLENYRPNSTSQNVRILNKDPDLWQVRFKYNGSTTTGPLGSDASATSPLRGVRANRTLILDEANDVGFELYNSVIRPFSRVAANPIISKRRRSAVTRFTKIESGTIKYDYSRFAQEIGFVQKRFLEGMPGFWIIEFNYEDYFHFVDNIKPVDYQKNVRELIKNGTIVFNYLINLPDMMDELLSGATSMEDFNSENKNIMQGSAGSEFSSELLDSITNIEVEVKFLDKVDDEDSIFYDPNFHDKTLFPLLQTDDPCILGVDPAKENDDAAFVLQRLGEYRKCKAPFNDIINCSTWHNLTYEKIAAKIREYLRKFSGIKYVYMDQSGGGLAVLEYLMKSDAFDSLPLYDPNYEMTPAEVKQNGLPILRLDAATNDKNTFRVNYVKAQMQSRRYLLPGFLYYTGQLEMDEQYRYIRQLRQQFNYIVSEPSGNFRKYYTENGRKKDLFSAALLAAQGVYDVSHNESQVVIHSEYSYF
jgi:hypothetical protein